VNRNNIRCIAYSTFGAASLLNAWEVAVLLHREECNPGSSRFHRLNIFGSVAEKQLIVDL